TTAAAAARAASVAANSAADHAEKAAAAADEAVLNAGKAIDYANKSTAHAAEAVKAANLATQAITDALEVEKNARAAEAQTLEQDKQQAIEEAQQLAAIEQTELSDVREKRLMAERTSQQTKDVIAQAETALYSGDMTLAATLGRQAAIALIDARGAYTRQAAQHALAGSDDDIFAWIDLDRSLAQGQDDRETTLHVATIGAPKVAAAAAAALESNDSLAVGDFLTSGMKRASDEELRVAINKILADEDAGKAVKEAGNDALDSNTTESLNYFFDHAYPLAVQEDDRVRASELIATAGAFTTAYAEVALEGPAWMLRNFITVIQYRTAQLDFDTATHVAAVRGAIAAAAKIAEKAQEDAALASKAAADARNAAAEAQEWAQKALDSAAKADDYAQQARDNATAADKSAADAQASATTAKNAAATARSASRSANYSANKAVDSARAALASSAEAQRSAASARASELAANADAKAAAAAYSQAKQIAADKKRAEDIAKAKAAALAAEEQRKNNQNPADNDKNNQVNPNGTADGDADEWWNDAQFYADAANVVSIGAGFLAAGCALAAFVFPPALAAAGFFAGVSAGAGALGTLFTGIEHGFTSGAFFESAVGTGLSLVSFGAYKWVGAADKALGGGLVKPIVGKITDTGEDLVSGITKGLSDIWGLAA
ncbi:MAG TPA: ALF repeat-containing protein, partial [Streptomyces sp.]